MQASARNLNEKRSEARTILDKYSSVEFSLENATFLYQFRLWDVSQNGLCVLVKEDSELLNHLNVGDKMVLRYYKPDSRGPTDPLETEIRHITKNDNGRFKGHCLVGLSILDRNPSHL